MDGPGGALQRGPVGPAGERAHPAQVLGPGLVHPDLDKPLDRVAVEAELIDRLSRAHVAQLGRAVGGQHEQRHPGPPGFDDGRGVVGRGAARGTGQRHGAPRRLGSAEAEEGGTALIDVGVGADSGLAGKREDDRGAARSRRGAGVLQATARELVAKGAQEQIGVGRGHDGGMAAAVVLLHGFTNTGASWDPVISALPQSYRALAPDLRGHGSATGAQPVSLNGVLADLGAAAPSRFALVGYSMGGRLALHIALALPERVTRLILIGASPGLADPHARQERRRADEALADELQGLTMEAFAARWARTPVLAGAPPDVAARAQRDRLRNTPEGLAGRCGGWAQARLNRCGIVSASWACRSSSWPASGMRSSAPSRARWRPASAMRG